ncbi:hypothetical protein BGZ63DRAFT_400554 [Mariannaea sp. PMI_226]|nr:hypothetical protein BGZ63DRAFT_400554 [Mariannaea sp. PMI_226]
MSSSSADTRPISPARFAAALKDLSIAMLHLKVLEIRNSIAHLQYSNDQLKPFAEGSATALSESNPDAASSGAPDQDCIDAIKENEVVIERMAERIAIIRVEVEERGLSWDEFQTRDEVQSKTEDELAGVNGEPAAPASEPQSDNRNPWTDGTFQTGTIRNGEVHMDQRPGQSDAQNSREEELRRADDERLRRAIEERLRNLETEDGSDGGMHL